MTLKSQSERRHQARHAVLNAAASEFSTFGFEGASLNRIADEASLSKQRLVYYFGTKVDLWKETADWVFNSYEEDFSEAMSEITSKKPLPIEEAIRAYAEVSARHPAYILMPWIEGVRESWRTTYLAENYLRKHNQSFAKLILENTGLSSVEELDTLSLQLLGAGGVQMLIGLLPLWRESGAVDSLEQAISHYATTVANLLPTN